MRSMRQERFLGFDIGGTKCAVSISVLDGENLRITAKKQIETDHGESPYETIDRMYRISRELGAKEETVGISCGGPLDCRRGIIESPPNLPGWDKVEIVRYLHDRYGVRSYLENDGNACALAEWLFGSGKGSQNMVFLTFGTGMGAGLILNGKLYRGSSGDAGEVGHVRLERSGPVGYGKPGSFEGFCSGNGLAQLGELALRRSERLGKGNPFGEETVSAKDLAALARQGNKEALEVFALCEEKLGAGLSILIDILNPEKIVIGSIYGRSGDLLYEHMRKALKRECLPRPLRKCAIVASALGEEIGDYAANCVAIYRQKGKEYAI